jgi:hypothetical protein
MEVFAQGVGHCYGGCISCPFNPERERGHVGDCISHDKQARHDFAVGWLERHRKPERFLILRKRADAVIKHYPIPPDDDTTTTWPCGVMDSRLLADEVLAFLDNEALRQGYTK